MTNKADLKRVREALDLVEAIVRSQPITLFYEDAHKRDDERDYIAMHRERFEQTLLRLVRDVPAGGRVLDVGSHFLHLALAMRQLGLDVVCIDQPLYAANPTIRARAGTLLELHTIASLDEFPFADASFDGIAFIEILEHLTFNPRAMWRELRRILKPTGDVYLTTPNYYRLASLLMSVARLVGGQGGGLRVKFILSEQVGGPHWKEYSLPELKHYFAAQNWRVASHEWMHYWPKRWRVLHMVSRIIPPVRDGMYLRVRPQPIGAAHPQTD